MNQEAIAAERISRLKSNAETVVVARQPISDVNSQTFGYELLFRNSYSNCATISHPEQATAQVIVNSFLEIGFERMVGNMPAFINVTEHFILDGFCRALPKDRVVFEILEDTIPSRRLLEELAALTAAGYRFALDDFTFQPLLLSLLPFCSFVKVDLRQVDRRQLETELPALRESHLKLLAEKVETVDEFEQCREAGFDYFQGYFFCRPKIVAGTSVPSNRIAICRLMAKLQQPNITTKEIETIVREDVSLSYRLLRYINSASVSLNRSVQSISHAVRMAGTEQIRLLASLIMLTSLDDKPRELVTTSLIRAKMCDLIAGHLGHRVRDSFFTVGLFSTLDGLLDCPMAEALESLPLAQDILDALLKGEGDVGAVLGTVLSYERADWESAPKGLSSFDLGNAYLQSVTWADSLVKSLAVHA